MLGKYLGECLGSNIALVRALLRVLVKFMGVVRVLLGDLMRVLGRA